MTNTTNRIDERLTLSRHIDATLETVGSLIADLHQQPLRLGRYRLHVDTSTGLDYRLKYRLTTGHAVLAHSVQITLHAGHDGGTELAWAVPRRRLVSRRGRGRHARAAAAMAELAARLAATAEDRPMTRAEWANQTFGLAA